MNAIQRNRFTEAWRAFGAAAGAPRAILAISAHWYTHATVVTTMSRPRTIHDFFGFPLELFDVRYPAPGDPDLADEIAEVVEPMWVGEDPSAWGLDHGTWSVLVHVFPAADVPVVQLSINASKSLDYHFELATKLAPLRERGVLILCSGNVVHNLALVDWGRPDGAFGWNRRFDEAARELMTGEPAEILRLAGHRDYAAAVPTPDHFIPLLYLGGLAAAAGEPAEVLVEGPALGSLSMTSYTLGARCELADAGDHGAVPFAGPPGDQTNL